MQYLVIIIIIIGKMVFERAKILYLAIPFEVLAKLCSSGMTRSRVYYNLKGKFITLIYVNINH